MVTPDVDISIGEVNWSVNKSEASVKVESKPEDHPPHRFSPIVSATLLAGAFIFSSLSLSIDNPINQAQNAVYYVPCQISNIKAMDEDSSVQDKKTEYNFQTWAYNSILETQDEFEVMTLSQEIRDLVERLNIIDGKYDNKIDGIKNDLKGEFKELSVALNKIDTRLSVIETKVSITEGRTTNFKLYVLLPLITTAMGGILASIIWSIGRYALKF